METRLLLGNFDGTPGTPSHPKLGENTRLGGTLWLFAMNFLALLLPGNCIDPIAINEEPLPILASNCLLSMSKHCQKATSLTVDGSVKHFLTVQELPKPLLDYSQCWFFSHLCC